MARVVTVGGEAWSLHLLREKGRIESGGLVLTWKPGQNSALDSPRSAEGRDVGNVVVQRRSAKGPQDVVYDVAFAFVFHAFHPDGILGLPESPLTRPREPSAEPWPVPPRLPRALRPGGGRIDSGVGATLVRPVDH